MEFWQDCIDKFYDKYKGLYKWHIDLVQEVIRSPDHSLTIPTGRKFIYEQYKDNWGNWKWPRTTILNYPVQGFGADLMAICRVSLFRRIRARSLSSILISTVHDSILIDSPDNEVEEICSIIKSVWNDLPGNFYKVFLSKLDLPTKCEIKIGPDWGNMKEIK